MRPGSHARRAGALMLASAALAAAPSATPAPAPPAPAPPVPAATQAALPPPKVDIPFVKEVLSNGLTVILHEDHALPIVTVDLLVKVGSRYEEAHRTGFAHLFEHLMFMGTARVPTKMFDVWMEAEGGFNNAGTSEDRTEYYDVGPSHSLPLLLWLEADRFASLGKEMNADKLQAQRDVVRNERRQTSENKPYGKVELRLPELLYPEGHPYHHPVIGSHEDLEAATVPDVKAFFDRFYVPNNLSLVVAGDIDPQQTRASIQTLFGAMPRAATPPSPAATPAKLTTVVRETLLDNVTLPKTILAYHSPARWAAGDAEMDLAGLILEHGKASRLYKALVYDRPLAQEVTAYQASQDLGSYFAIEAIAQPGVKLDDLEAAIDAEVAKLVDKPVSAEELQRAKNQFETSFVSRLQSVSARAALLNRYEADRGDPGSAEKDLQRYREVTPASLQRVMKSVLDPHARVVLRVLPKPKDAAPAIRQGGTP